MFTQYFTAKMRRLTFILSALLSIHSLSGQTTLEQYCESVIEYSTTLQRASLDMESAEWELRRARRGYLPEVGINSSASIDIARHSISRNWGWAATLEARQRLYDGGSRRAEVQGDELEVEILQLAHAMALREIRLEAEEAYWRLSHATEYVEAMRHYKEIIERLWEVTRRRYDEGYSAKGDLLQIESRLSDAEYQLSSATEARKLALHSFNSLCNNTIETEATLGETILSTPPTPPRLRGEELIATHPEHLIAELRAGQGQWQVRGVQSHYMPKIDIRAYGTLQHDARATNTNRGELTAGALISLSTTIFHFRERHAAVQSAKATQLGLEVEIENVRDMITLLEEDAWTRILATWERVESQTKSLAIVSENLEISTYAYNEGIASILDVMQAQISWLQTYKNYLAAHYDYHVARAEYQYVTGI